MNLNCGWVLYALIWSSDARCKEKQKKLIAGLLRTLLVIRRWNHHTPCLTRCSASQKYWNKFASKNLERKLQKYFERIFEPFCILFYANVFNVSNVQYLSLCCCGHAFIRLWLRNELALKVDSWQGGEAIAVIGDCNQFHWCRAPGISFEVAVRGKQSLKQGEATMTEATTEDNEWLFIVSEHFHESNSDLGGRRHRVPIVLVTSFLAA